LRATEELLKSSDIFKALFKGLWALARVRQIDLARYPIALLLKIKELPHTGCSRARGRAHVRRPAKFVCASSADSCVLAKASASLSIAPNAPPNDTSKMVNMESLRDHDEKVA